MPTSALPRISVRADVGIGPYELNSTNPYLQSFEIIHYSLKSHPSTTALCAAVPLPYSLRR